MARDNASNVAQRVENQTGVGIEAGKGEDEGHLRVTCTSTHSGCHLNSGTLRLITDAGFHPTGVYRSTDGEVNLYFHRK